MFMPKYKATPLQLLPYFQGYKHRTFNNCNYNNYESLKTEAEYIQNITAGRVISHPLFFIAYSSDNREVMLKIITDLDYISLKNCRHICCHML